MDSKDCDDDQCKPDLYGLVVNVGVGDWGVVLNLFVVSSHHRYDVQEFTAWL